MQGLKSDHLNDTLWIYKELLSLVGGCGENENI